MRHHLMAIGLGVLALGAVPTAVAQTPTVAGTWKLNAAESDDTQEKMRLATRGEKAAEFGVGMRDGGGRVRTGAGRVSGGSSGGGGSDGRSPSSGGGGGGGGNASGGPSSPLARIVRPAAQIVIELSDSMIVIKEGGEIPQKIYLDGRTVQEPALIGPPAEMTAKWKDGKLTVERKTGLLDTTKETYSIDPKTNRLIVEAKVTSTNFQRPLELKRVYDPAT